MGDLIVVAQKKSSEPKVTRISASDKSAPAKPVARKNKATASKVVSKTNTKAADQKLTTSPVKESKPSLLRKLGGYFKGAWYELTQVRWPNRRTAWGLTLAVILFSAFFVTLVVILDTVFGKLFNLVIG